MSEHEHKWHPAGQTKRSRVSASPCSTWDDHLWDDIILLQSCECGEIRRTLIGFTNRRRRGDDGRRARGMDPLGTPLRPEGMYPEPKVLS